MLCRSDTKDVTLCAVGYGYVLYSMGSSGRVTRISGTGVNVIQEIEKCRVTVQKEDKKNTALVWEGIGGQRRTVSRTGFVFEGVSAKVYPDPG